MLKLVLTQNNQYKVGRFTNTYSLRTADTLYTDSGTNSISINSANYTSWEEWYNNYITARLTRLGEQINDQLDSQRIRSINGFKGDVYLLAGKGIAIQQNANTIGICSTMYNTKIDKAFNDLLNLRTIQNAINYIMRYQLCLYHYLNVPIHRSLTTTGTYQGNPSYGSYLRYLSIKARWNHYVFLSWFNCQVVGGDSDSIAIAVGVNNILNSRQEANITVTIKPLSQSDYMIWHGIFLEEASTLDTNVTTNSDLAGLTEGGAYVPIYKILREGGVCYQLRNDYYSARWEGIEQQQIAEDDAVKDKEEAEEDAKKETEEEIEELTEDEGAEGGTEDEGTEGGTEEGGTEEDSNEKDNKIGLYMRDPRRRDAFAKRAFYPTPERSDNGNYADHNHPADSSAYTTVATPADITNPNNCMWSQHGGAWTNGIIQIPRLVLDSGQSFKQVYSISRHPAVSGRTTRDRLIKFNITVDFSFGDYQLTRYYNNVGCWMQCPDPTGNKDKSNEVQYILTATESMGLYNES